MTEMETRPARRPTRSGRTASRITRPLYIVIAALGVLYAPLAVNYMWPYFNPDLPRLQNSVDAMVNGWGYAEGPGSVHDVRRVDYVQHKEVMAVHTTLAGLALALAMFQFSARLRTRLPGAHRWMGRAYLVLITISMIAAIIFLIAGGPFTHFIGRGFDLQLWTIAVATLGSSWYALYAIRKRDLPSHRAWMGFSVSLMLTAPLLRVGWIGLQPIVPQHDLLTNLGASAIVLAIVAPFGPAVALMLTDHRRSWAPPAPAKVYLAVLATAVAGSLAFVATAQRLPDWVPTALIWYYLVPLFGALAITLVGVRNARAAHDSGREQRWRWLAWGVAASPVGACVTSLLTTPIFNSVDSVLSGAMVGSTIPIGLAFATVVYHGAPGRIRRAPRRAAVTEEPAHP